MSHNAHLHPLFLAMLTMMERRGYDIDGWKPFFDYSSEQFVSLFSSVPREPTLIQACLIEVKQTDTRSMMSTYLAKKGNPSDIAVIFFAMNDSKKTVSVEQVRILGQIYDTLLKWAAANRRIVNITTGILISRKELYSTARTAMDEGSSKIYQQTFLDEELSYDPTVSSFGSSLRVLTPEEAKEFLAKERIRSDRQLPQASTEDPVVKYLGIAPGAILELTRDNLLPEMLCDEEIFYRLVVKKSLEKRKGTKK